MEQEIRIHNRQDYWIALIISFFSFWGLVFLLARMPTFLEELTDPVLFTLSAVSAILIYFYQVQEKSGISLKKGDTYMVVLHTDKDGKRSEIPVKFEDIVHFEVVPRSEKIHKFEGSINLENSWMTELHLVYRKDGFDETLTISGNVPRYKEGINTLKNWGLLHEDPEDKSRLIFSF